MKVCPFCEESIKEEARVCRYCRTPQEGAESGEEPVERGRKAGKTGTGAADTWTHKVRKAREPKRGEGDYRVVAVRAGEGVTVEQDFARVKAEEEGRGWHCVALLEDYLGGQAALFIGERLRKEGAGYEYELAAPLPWLEKMKELAKELGAEGWELVYAKKGTPSTLFAGLNLWDSVRASLSASGTKITNEARRNLMLHIQAYRRRK